MQAWNQDLLRAADVARRSRVVGQSVVRGAMTTMWAPVVAGRVYLAARLETAGRTRVKIVSDDVVASRTDAELMARVASGDNQAFAEVYDRHAGTLYGAVMRYLRDSGAAEDVVQETYLAMWARSETYSPEAGSLIGWLLTIARHRAIDRLRSASRQPATLGLAPTGSDGEEDDLERLFAFGRPVGLAETADEPSRYAERRWVRTVVRTALDNMPEQERQALELAYDQELTQAEIAERLGWPIGTVKTRTRRALLRMRSMLEGVPDIGPSSGIGASRGPGPDPEEVQRGSL